MILSLRIDGNFFTITKKKFYNKKEMTNITEKEMRESCNLVSKISMENLEENSVKLKSDKNSNSGEL